MIRVLSLIAIGLASLSPNSPAFAQGPGGHGDHKMIAPSDLTWADVPSLPPGAKIAVIEGPLNQAIPFTFRLKLPANYRIPAHQHPAVERLTVLSGTFHLGMGDKLDTAKTYALTAGSVAIMQPQTNHFAWTADETVLQLHGIGPWSVTYVDPANDPRKK
jgi:quercetin dioxygenase-like cupin family protein